jgi:hypothetical protein
MSGRRTDAGAAVAGLFARSTATGGLANREPAPATRPTPAASAARLRQCVELFEGEVSYLRGLSRPDRTGQPRSHGSKFVATGVLMAAVELLGEVEVDMWGVEAGDVGAMKARAKAALIAAGAKRSEVEE